MKIYLRNPDNFHKETIKFYEENFKITDAIDSADIVVVNDFGSVDLPSKVVARNSTGLDGIIAKEIISLRGEDLSDITSVAELTIGMAICCMRGFKKDEIKGKTLGIIGYGRIGKQLEEYAENLGMDVLWSGYDSNSHIIGYPLEDVLKLDIVALCITADEENRGFMDKEKFDIMREETIFLNPSRDWLVDREAFEWALDNKLAGAWEDFMIDTQVEKENLMQTDHLGGSTNESRKKTELLIGKKLLKLKNNAV